MAAKVSRLCMHCPNYNPDWPNDGEGKCRGYYLREAQGACLTFKSWKGGKLTFPEAVEAKKSQFRRHNRTDRFREETVAMILKYQEPLDEDYLEKRANDLAARIAKGENAYNVFEQAKDCTSLYLPKKLCRAIEENRHRFIGA
ncbi:MAG: hypothetical protein ACOCZX_02905 [Candidatus Bipolaricaulota bacterium]